MPISKDYKSLGRELRKTKNWTNATNIGSRATDVAGNGLILAGGATGQPEIIAVGAGLVGTSKVLGKTSKLLKKFEK